MYSVVRANLTLTDVGGGFFFWFRAAVELQSEKGFIIFICFIHSNIMTIIQLQLCEFITCCLHVICHILFYVIDSQWF